MGTKAIIQKKPLKIDFTEMLREVFWTGRTETGVVWIMFVIGFVFGRLMFKC